MPRSSIVATVDSLLYKDVLESVLLCTINEEPSNGSNVYLPETASTNSKKWTKTRIDQALFERLRMIDPSSHLISSTNTNRSLERHENITENRCLYYLSACYQRLARERNEFQEIFNDLRKLFIDHSKTAITLPDIYDGQNLSKQWLELLVESRDNKLLCEYIDEVNNELLRSITDEIRNFYENIFRYMYQNIQSLDYFSNELITYISVLIYLSQWSGLVQIIFHISHPKTLSNRLSISHQIHSANGRTFQDTLIGSFLCKSSLPSSPDKPYIFFDKPKPMNERDIEIMANTICQPIKIYQENLTLLFKAIVKNADVRNYVLQWIGDCLYENQEKNKDWTPRDPFIGFVFVSDGFILNLNIILLHLTRPFAEPYSLKLLKINPIYCINQTKHVHLKELYKQTSIIPREENDQNVKISDVTFNFITESFFMAHLSYSYSINRLRRILGKINDEIPRIREAYDKSVNSYGKNHENTRQLDDAMEKDLTIYFNIRSVLNEPCLLELSNALFTATCTWLVHLALIPSTNSNTIVEEKLNVIQKLPLKFKPNRQLSYIPEFVVENIICYLKFLGQYNEEYFQSIASSINEYVNFILVFMGDANRLRNPHLRASLAEVFETILSCDKSNNSRSFSVAEAIFKEHPFIEHLPRVLLDVFVSIELTGQAVAFDQKFNYRRPMYEILEYLWKYEKQRVKFQKLASSAERHIEDAEAPLFLRFINLLMNDANFLLDEALTYMTRLKSNQESKESGEWDNLPEQQREELENTFRNTGRTARYMNIMSIKTLVILDMITQEIQSIFCHPTICERLAAMLNYFLQHLVGPKRQNLKVRDLKEYLFEPQKLVAKVTDIYLNFAKYDRFCAAVSNDGMSYNEQLFPQAIEVLERIRHPPERITAFLQLGEHIKKIAAQQKDDDGMYNDAPEEYLDPITDTLMSDPVMLPISRKILDRTTIQRHLLSDQTDPFNRKPLRMQDVIPQVELKRTIEQWKASKHR
ncbi:hypothetical protein I4U23_029878 [Adineta vaga]|nr:hypothetical protein I4U23_029878 [Adineta vaga]